MQTILHNITGLEKSLEKISTKKFFLVCDASYRYLKIKDQIDSLPFEHVVFNGFSSNPIYEDVCCGVELFNREKCDTILVVGGGSAMDVAKCIKLFATMDPEKNYLEQPFAANNVPLLAMPTTAGTGSEATRYAVIYYKGEKQSVTHDSIIPNYVLLDPSVLQTLPDYQRKVTMLDALCHGIESFWSVNSNEESKAYSRGAIQSILANMDGYLQNTEAGNTGMLLAAHTAGKAINITQTTAGHAMSYKLTSLYGIAHGHAVAVCLPEVWAYMRTHLDRCVDVRGTNYLKATMDEIAEFITPDSFQKLLQKLEINRPVAEDKEAELELLTRSVNLTRLKNNPVKLEDTAIREIYDRVVK